MFICGPVKIPHILIAVNQLVVTNTTVNSLGLVLNNNLPHHVFGREVIFMVSKTQMFKCIQCCV